MLTQSAGSFNWRAQESAYGAVENAIKMSLQEAIDRWAQVVAKKEG